MNELELQEALEKAGTLEEVWQVASDAGIGKEAFVAVVNKADENSDDEIDEAELEQVSGGFGGIFGVAGYLIYKKLKKIRQERYQAGYDEEYKSDARIGKSC